MGCESSSGTNNNKVQQPLKIMPQKLKDQKQQTSMINNSQFNMIIVNTPKKKQTPNIQQIFSSQKLKQQWSDTLNQFLNKIRSLQKEFLTHRYQNYYNDQGKMNFRNAIWNFIQKQFQDNYLNNDEKMELVEWIVKFYRLLIDDQKKNREKIDYKALKTPFIQLPYQKYNDLENKMAALLNKSQFRKKFALRNCKFQSKQIKSQQDKKSDQLHFPNLSFDLNDEKQFIGLCSLIRFYCQNNINSFSYISLYMMHCSFRTIGQGSIKFVELQNLLKGLLKKIELLHPANVQNPQKSLKNQKQTNQTQEKHFIQDEKNIASYEKCVFKSKESKSHYEQMRQFIIEKAKKAELDKEYFSKLIKDILIQKGYGFKLGLKIYLNNKNSEISIYRIIQKLLQKDVYLKQFQELKQLNLQKADQLFINEHNGLKKYVHWEEKQVQLKTRQILENISQIQFDSKDMIRAKCIFNTKQDIYNALQLLRKRIISKGCKILQLKNRLMKNTKDITIIIRLPNSIAQLQLALKLDTVANEFNHKIYQLLRSKTYTIITTVFIMNKKWCTSFFQQNQKVYNFMLKQQEKNIRNNKKIDEKSSFKIYKKQIEQFKQVYLTQELLQIKTDNSLEMQQKINLRKLIDQSILKLQNEQKSYLQQNQRLKITISQQLTEQKKMKKGQQLKRLQQQKIKNQQLKQFQYLIILGYFYQKFKQTQKIVQILNQFRSKFNKNSAFKINYQDYFQFYELFFNQIQIKKHQSDYQKSSQMKDNYIKILKTIQSEYGKNNILYLKKLNQYGIYQGKQDKTYKYCKKQFQQSIRIIQQLLSNHHSQNLNKYFIESYNHIAKYFISIEKIQEAMQYLKKTENIIFNQYGKQSHKLKSIYLTYTQLYVIQKQQQKSILYYEKSLYLLQKQTGKQTKQYAQLLFKYSQFLKKNKNNQKALNLLEQHLLIIQKIYGSRSLQYLQSHKNITTILDSIDRKFYKQKIIKNRLFELQLAQNIQNYPFQYQKYRTIKYTIQRLCKAYEQNHIYDMALKYARKLSQFQNQSQQVRDNSYDRQFTQPRYIAQLLFKNQQFQEAEKQQFIIIQQYISKQTKIDIIKWQKQSKQKQFNSNGLFLFPRQLPIHNYQYHLQSAYQNLSKIYQKWQKYPLQIQYKWKAHLIQKLKQNYFYKDKPYIDQMWVKIKISQIYKKSIKNFTNQQSILLQIFSQVQKEFQQTSQQYIEITKKLCEFYQQHKMYKQFIEYQHKRLSYQLRQSNNKYTNHIDTLLYMLARAYYQTNQCQKAIEFQNKRIQFNKQHYGQQSQKYLKQVDLLRSHYVCLINDNPNQLYKQREQYWRNEYERLKKIYQGKQKVNQKTNNQQKQSKLVQ